MGELDRALEILCLPGLSRWWLVALGSSQQLELLSWSSTKGNWPLNHSLVTFLFRQMKMQSKLKREKRLNSSSFHQQCLIEENIKTGQRNSRDDSI